LKIRKTKAPGSSAAQRPYHPNLRYASIWRRIGNLVSTVPAPNPNSLLRKTDPSLIIGLSGKKIDGAYRY
jgi:hypothetical protein